MTSIISTPKILLGVTGSVATVKICELVVQLTKFAKVKVVSTKAAEYFTNIASSYAPEYGEAFEQLRQNGDVSILSDTDEWEQYKVVGHDPVLHIELRKWADILVIAPLSANTMAKISHGMCDNLLTCVARAWPLPLKTQISGSHLHPSDAATSHSQEIHGSHVENTPQKPFLVAPAMNTAMWEHPLTAQQLSVLSETLGIHVLPPQSKTLACGDTGSGAMASVTDIVTAVRTQLGLEA